MIDPSPSDPASGDRRRWTVVVLGGLAGGVAVAAIASAGSGDGPAAVASAAVETPRAVPTVGSDDPFGGFGDVKGVEDLLECLTAGLDDLLDPDAEVTDVVESNEACLDEVLGGVGGLDDLAGIDPGEVAHLVEEFDELLPDVLDDLASGELADLGELDQLVPDDVADELDDLVGGDVDDLLAALDDLLGDP